MMNNKVLFGLAAGAVAGFYLYNHTSTRKTEPVSIDKQLEIPFFKLRSRKGEKLSYLCYTPASNIIYIYTSEFGTLLEDHLIKHFEHLIFESLVNYLATGHNVSIEADYTNINVNEKKLSLQRISKQEITAKNTDSNRMDKFAEILLFIASNEQQDTKQENNVQQDTKQENNVQQDTKQENNEQQDTKQENNEQQDTKQENNEQPVVLMDNFD